MTISSTPATLEYVRGHVRALLNEFDAADGLASYYALHYDDRRTMLYMHRNQPGEVDGMLARCQTGFDLFRPLVTMRVRGLNANAIESLVNEGLTVGRPYLLVVPDALIARLEPYLIFGDLTHNLIHRLDPSRYRPEMNTLIVHRTDQNGSPRTEIHAGDTVIAAAGVNWRSPIFAEIFVNVQPQHRGGGLGRAVVNALVGDLLKLQVTPLYNTAESNTASRQLAEQVGFVDTGAREAMAQVERVGDGES